jgi:hypothetical protein
MKWFRFYAEFRSDPKMRRMPVAHRYAFIILLCLSSESEVRGTISGIDDDDLAFELEMSTEDWQTLKAKFRVKGLIEFDSETITICNWDKRQFESDSSAERVAAYRARKKAASSNADVTLHDRYSNADVTRVTASEAETETDPNSDPNSKAESKSDPREEKKEDLIGSSPLSISVDTVPPPVEEIASGCSKSKGKGKGKSDKVAKPKPQLPLELERFKNLYNDRRPQLWAAMQLVSPDRQKTWKALVETVGGVEEALTALGNALDFCAADSWYSSKTLNFENFATNGKILQLHERQISKVEMAGSGAPGMTASDARMMHTYNQLMEAGRNAGYA